MDEKPDDKQLVIFLELLMPHVIQLNTITQLLIEKGIITKEEFSAKKNLVQNNYEKKLAGTKPA